jgi:hypothetical protein
MFGIIGMELIYHTITTNSNNRDKRKIKLPKVYIYHIIFRSKIDISKKHVIVFCLTWYDNGYTNETIVALWCGF